MRPGGPLSMLLALCTGALLAGCPTASSSTAGPQASGNADGADGAGRAGRDGPRIVSLSPALTRTLVDLGLAERIVGRSTWCRAVDEQVPEVGDGVTEIDFERLIRLQPTHLFVQRPATGLDPELVRLAGEQGWTLGHWRINTLEDIRATIREIPPLLPAGIRPGTADRADQLMDDLASALAADPDTTWTGPTLLVGSVSPVRVHARGTYLADLMERMGGSNAATETGWAELDVERLLRMDPPAMIFVRDSGPADVDPFDAAGPLADLDLTAVREGRIAVLWHTDANLPGSGVIGVCAELRRALADLGRAPGP